MFARMTKVLAFHSVGRADYGRWTDSRNLEAWWDSRTEILARLIPRGARVIEFGAGRRQLEKMLGNSCLYFPADLVDRGPGTIVFDLNTRPLPDLSYLNADVAVFGGTLEYLSDLESVVEWLAQQVRYCVASYAYTDNENVLGIRERLARCHHGYMNNYTEEELEQMFRRCGFICKAKEAWASQRIFLFVNQERVSTSHLVATENL